MGCTNNSFRKPTLQFIAFISIWSDVSLVQLFGWSGFAVILTKSKLFNALSVVFLPSLDELDYADTGALLGSSLEPFSASIRDMLDEAAGQARFGRNPKFIRTVPSIDQELPYYPRFNNQAGWRKLANESYSEERYYSDLNPFPRMFIQLRILDVNNMQGPPLYEVIQSWLRDVPGREAFIFLPNQHRLFSLSEISHRHFFALIWPDGEPRLSALLGPTEVPRIQDFQNQNFGRSYGFFYRLCEKRETNLVAKCLFDQAELSWWNRFRFSSVARTFPCEYPNDYAYKRISPVLALWLFLLVAIAVIFGALAGIGFLLARIWQSLSDNSGTENLLFVFIVVSMAVWLQFRLLRTAFSENITGKEGQDTRIGAWATGALTAILFFVLVNLGWLAGLWEARVSIGQVFGFFVTIAFSPLIIGGSVLYAASSTPANAIYMSCEAIHSTLGFVGISGSDLFWSGLKTSIRIIAAPVFERQVWIDLTGLSTQPSIYDISWSGLATWAIAFTYLLLFLKCFFVG